jgi:hypothetical protein
MREMKNQISIPSQGYFCLSMAALCFGSLSLDAQNRQTKKPNIIT